MSKYQGVQTFEEKVIINDFWKIFSIRAVIGRSSSHESWEILLLLVQLDTNGIVLSRTLFENDLIKIIEEIREFDMFEDFLNRLFQENIIHIGGTEVLLEFVRFEPSHVFIERNKAASKIGVDYSGDLLFVKGGAASKFQQIKNQVDGMLLTNDPPYESLDDLIYDKLRVNARWDYEGTIYENRLVLMIFAPNFLRLEKPQLVNNQLTFRIFALQVPANSVKLSIIGKKGETVTYRKSCRFSETELKSNEVSTLEVDSESEYFLLRLFYYGQLVDSIDYNKPKKYLEKMRWIQSIVSRIDPDYEVLERWITGTSDDEGNKRDSKESIDFEKGVAILFNLCGLNAIHVGDDYENATQKNRSRVRSSRIDFPIDVLTWSTSDNIDEVLYLAQCVVAGKGQTIIGKINDMVSVSEEVNSILSTHTKKPHIYSAILTRMKKDDLKYEFKEAEERLVKIVTVEDLVYLLQAIRNHDLALSDEIHKILTIQTSADQSRISSTINREQGKVDSRTILNE